MAFFSTLEAPPVNLFLTKMFWKTSFKAWRKYTDIYQRRFIWRKKEENEKKQAERLGKDYIERPFLEPEAVLEDVEIEREVFLVMDCD